MLMRTVEEQWVEILPFDWQRDVMDKMVRACAREHDVVEDEVKRLEERLLRDPSRAGRRDEDEASH